VVLLVLTLLVALQDKNYVRGYLRNVTLLAVEVWAVLWGY